MFTNHQLKDEATRMAKEFWGMELNIPVLINGRLKRARGRFIHNRMDALRIEMSGDVIKYDSKELILSTLLHEVTHWALFTMKKPYKDGDRYFEAELRRVGAHSTRTVSVVGERYFVCCSKCGRKIGGWATERAARNKCTQRYFAKCCRAPLNYLGLETLSRVSDEPSPDVSPVPASQEPKTATGTMTAADLATMFGMDAKALRKKLRASGMKRDGGSWTFTPEQADLVRKMLGK